MAYTNIKTEIDGKIYTNILREITGDILNEVLKKMVDSLGKGYRYMGILDPDGSAPSGDENMFMIATEGGYYPAVSDDIPSGITICTFAEGSQGRETILNLDELFSNNHNWGGDNTFSSQLKVAFESLIDLNSDENLQDMLNALMPRVLTAVENHIATFDAYGRAKDSGVSVDDLAKKDGISEKLVSGSARGILSPSAIEELFLFQRTANGAGGTGAAVLQSIKGNSIVWNQLVKNGNFANGTTGWGSSNCNFSVSDGVATVLANGANGQITQSQTLVVGHKYLYAFDYKGASAVSDVLRVLYNSNLWLGAKVFSTTTSWQRGYNIFDCTNISDTKLCFRDTRASGWDNIYITNVILVDITALLNNNIPAGYAYADFTKFYNLPYYAPNPGAIKNNCATGMVTDGLNQWDEVWENGSFDTTTGANISNNQVRCKNLIPILPNTEYYANTSNINNSHMWAMFYDTGGNIITDAVVGAQSRDGNSSRFHNNAFTTPSTAAFMKFYLTAQYGTTYNHDICINLSGPRNGQYEPHWSDTLALPITTATGKLNGEGESVVISPNGLAGVGTSFDEAIVEKGMWTKTKKKLVKVSISADDDLSKFVLSSASLGVVFYTTGLGSEVKTLGNALTTNYGTDTTHQYSSQQTDMTVRLTEGGGISVKNTAQITGSITAEQARTLLAGMEIWVELATPQVYILDTPVPVVARVDEDGTQTILPQGVDESGTPMTAPFKASIQYPVKLGVAPIGQQSLVNLLERMKSAGKIASYTMFWDAATGAYDFTIS